MKRRLLSLTAILFVTLTIGSSEAAAQGRGRPKTPKAPAPAPAPVPAAATTTTTTTTTQTAAVDTGVSATPTTFPGFRQFGSWLDDASAPIRGQGHTGIGIGYWRVSGGSQTNMPMLDVGYGLTDRIQASASVPFYRASYDGGTARGLDDVYLSAKMTLIDPTLTLSEFGLAISPVVEVLSAGTPDGRVHFAIPVSAEIRRSPFRVYGSAGYFTRGSVFSGAAIEWSAPSGITITGAVTQAYSTNEQTTLDALGISRQRADATAGLAYPVAGIAAVYGSVGRTLTSLDEGGTSLSLAGGVSFRFSAARATP